jgi:hypothetical protein
MKSYRWLTVVILAAAFAAAAQGALPAPGKTARAVLSKATASAKGWQADAVLTSISTLMGKDDGTADQWLYSFYSPKSKKWVIVTAKGDALDSLEVERGLTEPVGDEFIDSDKAMQIAKQNGLKGKSPSFGLNVFGTGLTASVRWAVNGGFEKGDKSVTLDAKTGKFVSLTVIDF